MNKQKAKISVFLRRVFLSISFIGLSCQVDPSSSDVDSLSGRAVTEEGSPDIFRVLAGKVERSPGFMAALAQREEEEKKCAILFGRSTRMNCPVGRLMNLNLEHLLLGNT